MPANICFVYIWATSGGVERVFLNRAEALLRHDAKLSIDIYFYNDCGGVALLARYIKARNLSERMRIASSFDPSRYDAVFSVDTPQVFSDYPSFHSRMFMECHTPYPNHRTYLKEWEGRLNTLIVPSEPFRKLIEAECPRLRGKIQVVRNFVPRLPEIHQDLHLPCWRPPLFLYFGRIDDNKNFAEFVGALDHTRRRLGRDPLGIVCGPVVPDYPLKEVLRRNNAAGLVVLLPPIPFENSHVLMRLLRTRRAVYVSCSKGESFGLSVAEAMTVGLPVVLSDIPPHAMLVRDRARHLYELGNLAELSDRMVTAVRQYDELSAECLELSREFSEESFLADWEQLFSR